MGAVAQAIHAAFLAYHARFIQITRRAKARFEAREWREAQDDAVERLTLYRTMVNQTVDQVTGLIGGNMAFAVLENGNLLTVVQPGVFRCLRFSGAGPDRAALIGEIELVQHPMSPHRARRARSPKHPSLIHCPGHRTSVLIHRSSRNGE